MVETKERETKEERFARIRQHGFQDQDFAPYIKGEWTLQNCVPLDPEAALSMIASSGSIAQTKRGSFRDHRGNRQWAVYFLFSTQMGGLSGEGYCVIYRAPWRAANAWPTRGGAFRFALCKHENRSSRVGGRCYTISHCNDCGLNMSVDSSD